MKSQSELAQVFIKRPDFYFFIFFFLWFFEKYILENIISKQAGNRARKRHHNSHIDIVPDDDTARGFPVAVECCSNHGAIGFKIVADIVLARDNITDGTVFVAVTCGGILRHPFKQVQQGACDGARVEASVINTGVEHPGGREGRGEGCYFFMIVSKLNVLSTVVDVVVVKGEDLDAYRKKPSSWTVRTGISESVVLESLDLVPEGSSKSQENCLFK